MQLKSLELESSNDYYDAFLDSLTITTDILSDPIILKDDHLYFCDLGHACERLEQFRKTFNKIQPCYPIECNDAKDLLIVLANSGVSFSCSNKESVSKFDGFECVTLCNMTAEENLPQQSVKSVCDVGKVKSAMFGTADVQKSHLKFSMESGIEVMNFQNEFELKKLATLQLSSNCRFIIQFDWESDGMTLTSRVQHMKKLARIAQKMQLSVIGISVGHIPEEKKDDVKDIIDGAISVLSFMESISFQIGIIDLGNCCSLASTSLDMVASEDCNSINSALDSSVFLRWPSVTVLADVSRIVAKSAFSLMVTVTRLETVANTTIQDTSSGQSVDGCIYINDSIYGSFSKNLQNSMLAASLPKLIVPQFNFDSESLSSGCDSISSRDQEEEINFCVRGKSGNALDIVLSGCLLPKNIQIGDKLLFENMGDFHCVLRTGNGETPPTMHSFINADQIDVAKRLKRKTFSFTNVSTNDERRSCQDLDYGVNRPTLNVGASSTGCGDELTHSDFDVIFENIALLEPTQLSARHLDYSLSPENNFDRFGSDEALDPVEMPLFEQMRYQANLFAFI